ncbi:DNA topoisomerase 3-alpha [Acromyrmex echinatior]|uniref:DNA topoisomerase 3-alpha n=1 Tax=Acromyrmex echinatior TaxID=103372 RepID=F4X1K4_ACREC|nr:DNA topoisomerase 3-alpha [Acromyrmex echinatior]
MDVKEQDNGVEEIICDVMNAFENVQREIKIEMEKLKDEMRCKRTEINSEREDVECVWDTRIETKEWLEKFEESEKGAMQEERKKNNMKDALMSPTTPSTSQLQSTTTNTDFGRNNNDFNLIETPSTSSGRRAQNQNSNIFQLNKSNRPNTANNTVSKNRKNHTSSINFGVFNHFANKSDQSASNNSQNIMCNCKKPAVPRTEQFGSNKGCLFYKCSENVCNFLKWANEDSAKFQGNTGKKRSMVSRPDKNSDSNFSRPSTSKDNWDNPSTNIMCNCNQPAQKMAVYRDSPKKGRLFYRCPKGPTSTCHFFKWADKDDNTVPENAKKPKLIRGRRKCGICGTEVSIYILIKVKTDAFLVGVFLGENLLKNKGIVK